MLDALKAEGKDVIGVGKIYDIFEGQGVTETYPNQGNEKNMEKTIEIQKKEFDGLARLILVQSIRVRFPAEKPSRDRVRVTQRPHKP